MSLIVKRRQIQSYAWFPFGRHSDAIPVSTCSAPFLRWHRQKLKDFIIYIPNILLMLVVYIKKCIKLLHANKHAWAKLILYKIKMLWLTTKM